MVSEHGGKIDEIKFYPRESVAIKAKKDGFLNIKNPKKMGELLNFIGGVQNSSKKIDQNAGFKIIKKHGSYIHSNDTIAILFSSEKNTLNRAVNNFNKTFDISDKKLNSYKLIY